MTSWRFEPIFDSYLLVTVSICVLMALWLFVRPTRQLSKGRRFTLASLRFCLLLLILAGMLRPSRSAVEKKRQQGTIMIMLDQTISMQQPSVNTDVTRWQAQSELYTKLKNALGDLEENISVKSYLYSDEISADIWTSADPFPEEPVGEQTDIGTSLYRAVTSAPGDRVLGVILLGDGTQTAFRPQVEIRQAGLELDRRRIPLFTVPFGKQGIAGAGRDVAIEQLPQQYRVFTGNQLNIRCVARIRGLSGSTVPVRLSVQSEGQPPEVIKTLNVESDEAEVVIPIEMEYTAGQPGNYTLTIEADSQDGELLVENNQQVSFLTVAEGGLRVLYLFGNRVGEQLELKRTLGSLPDIELVPLFVKRPKDNDPVLRESDIDSDQYDVLLIEDVPAAAFGTENINLITKAVEDGKGIMMIGGFYSFGPGGYKNTQLSDVLPIEMSDAERQEVGVQAPLREAFHLTEEQVMVPTEEHAITRIAIGGDVAARWQALPRLLGANRFQGVKADSRILLENPEQQPLLVSGEYGLGRVLAFAGDSTWRWKRRGFEKELLRFWRQAILWLVGRENQLQSDVWINMAQRRYSPGSPVSFTVGARTTDGEQINDVTWNVTLVRPDQTKETLQLSQQLDDWTGNIDSPGPSGNYYVDVVASQQGRELGKTRADFQIIDQQPERTNTQADPQQLSQMAEMTSAHGGRLVMPGDAVDLIDEINDRAEQTEVELDVKWQLGGDATSAWSFLVVFCVVLSLEWILRKKWGFV